MVSNRSETLVDCREILQLFGAVASGERGGAGYPHNRSGEDGELKDQGGYLIYLFMDRISTDKLNMAMFLCSVRWTSHYLQATIKTRPCLTGHPVSN